MGVSASRWLLTRYWPRDCDAASELSSKCQDPTAKVSRREPRLAGGPSRPAFENLGSGHDLSCPCNPRGWPSATAQRHWGHSTASRPGVGLGAGRGLTGPDVVSLEVEKRQARDHAILALQECSVCCREHLLVVCGVALLDARRDADEKVPRLAWWQRADVQGLHPGQDEVLSRGHDQEAARRRAGETQSRWDADSVRGPCGKISTPCGPD